LATQIPVVVTESVLFSEVPILRFNWTELWMDGLVPTASNMTVSLLNNSIIYTGPVDGYWQNFASNTLPSGIANRLVLPVSDIVSTNFALTIVTVRILGIIPSSYSLKIPSNLKNGDFLTATSSIIFGTSSTFGSLPTVLAFPSLSPCQQLP